MNRKLGSILEQKGELRFKICNFMEKKTFQMQKSPRNEAQFDSPQFSAVPRGFFLKKIACFFRSIPPRVDCLTKL